LKQINFSLFLLFTITFFGNQSVFGQKTIEVDSTVLLIDGSFAPYDSLVPGDTIRLKPGQKQLLILRNLVGTTDQPIIITNGDGLVDVNSTHYFGISIRHCNHIKLTGTGKTNLKYGIRILNIQGSGLSIGDYSTNVETDHLEIGEILYSGIIAKTEPDCNFDRNTFIQENTIIHDCHIYNTGTEGMYVGSSFYSGQTLQCDSGPKIVLPALLRGVNIYDNIVEHTGWEGIQVSSAASTSIHHNRVSYDSQEKTDWQMTGITLGGGSTGSVFDNIIEEGEGTGVFTNGLGDINIYNNIIINPGKTNNQSSGNYGIYATDASAYPGMYFNIYNNLILHPKKTGILLVNSLSNDRNTIQNNVISTNNLQIGNNPSDAFIDINGNHAILKTNYCSYEDSKLQLDFDSNGKISILETSPLIDAGSTITKNDYPSDIYGNTRIQGFGVDIGPVESAYARAVNFMDADAAKDMAYPNPVKPNEIVTFIVNNEWPGYVKVNLIDESGRIIKTLSDSYCMDGNQSISIESNLMYKGINYIQITRTKNSNILRVVVNEQ
jgi:hypothetical protein